jgi:hypothetical protein
VFSNSEPGRQRAWYGEKAPSSIGNWSGVTGAPCCHPQTRLRIGRGSNEEFAGKGGQGRRARESMSLTGDKQSPRQPPRWPRPMTRPAWSVQPPVYRDRKLGPDGPDSRPTQKSRFPRLTPGEIPGNLPLGPVGVSPTLSRSRRGPSVGKGRGSSTGAHLSVTDEFYSSHPPRRVSSD